MSRVRKPAWRGTALRVGASALVLALLFRFVPVGQAWQAMRRVPLDIWLAVLAGYFAMHLAGVNKYKLMLNGAGAGLNFAQATRCYFAGLFSALLLPSLAGGDLVKAGLALRLGRSQAGVVLGSLADRLIDIAVLVALVAVGVAAAPGTLEPADRRGLTIAVMAVAGAAILAAAIFAFLPARRFSYRMRRRLVRLRRAAQSTARKPGRVAVALLLGLITQLGFLSLMTLLAAACGLHLPFRAWLFAWPLAKISALLPIGQAGIGVREATLAALLVPFGAAAGLVVGAGLAWETIVIAGGLISGLIVLLVGRCPSGQAQSVGQGAAAPPVSGSR